MEGKMVAIMIIAFILIMCWEVENVHKNLEKKYDEVVKIVTEVKEEVIDLATYNDELLKHYDEYTAEDYHWSASFEDAFCNIEDRIADIGW